MTVKELKEILSKCDDNNIIVVGCQGYTSIFEGVAEEVRVKQNGNIVLISDNCFVEGFEEN